MLSINEITTQTGFYPLAQAARILGISQQQLRRWVAPRQSLVPASNGKTKTEITFLDLIELHVVKIFRYEGIPLDAIREWAEVAAQKFQADYPFAVKRFESEGNAIFASLQKDQKDADATRDLGKGQRVFQRMVQPFCHKLDYGSRNDEAIRYWPLKKTGRVVLDPALRFGDPTDAETGVPTSALYRGYQVEQNLQVVAHWFDVPIEAIEAAVEFEESLLA